MSSEPQIAKEAVLVASAKLPDDTPVVTGYDWNNGINYDNLLESYLNSGFQATNFGKAVNEINKMVRMSSLLYYQLHVNKWIFVLIQQLDCREVPLKEEDIDFYEDDEFIKRKSSCTIFLGFTSNIVSSGVRDTIRFLVQHKMVIQSTIYSFCVWLPQFLLNV